jgi:hypothetical protein
MPNPDLTNQIVGKNGVSKTIAFATPPGIPPCIVGRMIIRQYIENGARGWEPKTIAFAIPPEPRPASLGECLFANTLKMVHGGSGNFPNTHKNPGITP